MEKTNNENTDVEKKEEQIKNLSKLHECGICMSEDVETNLIQLDSWYCKPCIQKYLDVEFNEKGKGFLDIAYPTPKSTQKFSIDQIKQYGSEETIKTLNAVLKTIPENPQDPNLSIDDFCYEFNDKNLLRHKETGEKFRWVNQIHYDLLGDLIVPYIQNKMITEFGMKQVFLPEDGREDSQNHLKNNIFMTPDVFTNKDKLMLLIQGSGAVRAGQWARALCINDSLDTGAIFGYLTRAIKNGYSVIVFNPNLNYAPKELVRPTKEEFFIPGKPKQKQNPEMVKIPNNSTPSEHTIHVFDQYANKSPAEKMVIVAHSAGGVCTTQLLKAREKELIPRLKAIAFTDSVHWIGDPPHLQQFINKHAINWIQSEKPLDTPEKISSDGCPCVSSGVNKHELTSASAIESVFKFLESKTS